MNATDTLEHRIRQAAQGKTYEQVEQVLAPVRALFKSLKKPNHRNPLGLLPPCTGLRIDGREQCDLDDILHAVKVELTNLLAEAEVDEALNRAARMLLEPEDTAGQPS